MAVCALKRLRHQTDEEGPFQSWITSHMFDETKLWYIVRGKGYRNLSTLAYHSQVTWEDRLGIHDEDIIRPPKAMRRYSAAGQWAILDEDPIAGVRVRLDQAPAAKFYGTLTATDSHNVNHLTLKHLRDALPPDHVLLPSSCMQHHTGTAATTMPTFLGLFTRVWCLAKTFGEGDFHGCLSRGR